MEHGGNIYSNDVRLDLSVNVNPLGVPDTVKKALGDLGGVLDNYPDPTCGKLRVALSEKLGVTGEEIIFTNGASELFMALVHAIRPRRILLSQPSFLGYKWVCNAAGCEVLTYMTRESDGFVPGEDILDSIKDVDLVFLTNPNNPTGAYMDRDLIVRVAKRCESINAILLLDECFMTLSDDPKGNTLIKELKTFPNLIIARAFTKSYAIPGVRLGYGLLSDKGLGERISSQLPEWSISIPAQVCGLAALLDEGFIERGREVIAGNRPRLMEILGGYGKTYPSNVNFVLVKSQLPLYEKLLWQGILIRDCSNFEGLGKGYYRFAVRDEKAMDILEETINSIRW